MPEPWETPEGRACIEKWIAESMSLLNKHDGGDEFNGRKPWSINKYGLLEGRRPAGPYSVAAPDNFHQYNNDKYWYMWDYWIPTGALGNWKWEKLTDAGVESIQAFVGGCLGK